MRSDKLLIVMEVTDAEGKQLNRMVLNFHDPEARQLIARTAWWAMHNNNTLITYPQQKGEQKQ